MLHDSSSSTSSLVSTQMAAAAERKEAGWHVGEVTFRTNYRKEQDIHLRATGGETYFLFGDKVSPHSLPPKAGDKMKFLLGKNKEGRLRVHRATPHQYVERTAKEIKQYLVGLREELESPSGNRVMLEVLPIKVMWSHLANAATATVDLEFSLLSVMKDLLRMSQGKDSNASSMVAALADSALVGDFARRACFEGRVEACGKLSEKKEILTDFLKEAVKCAPHCLVPLVPLFAAVHEDGDPAVATAFVRLLCVQLSLTSEHFDEHNWRTMAPVPGWKELLGDHLSEDKLLKEVQVAYSDPDEYMETFYRLTRTETFSAIQKGIKDLKAGKLDPRDMDRYTGVTLAAMDVTSSTIRVGLRFNTAKPVRDWSRSSKLMFGNLLCISFDQRFDDVIWAVITHRDTVLLEKNQIIFVELCDFNRVSAGEAIALLRGNGSRTVMAESPTYFRSLWPVLQSLKEFDLENCDMSSEIVRGKWIPEKPKYTQPPELQLVEALGQDEEGTPRDLDSLNFLRDDDQPHRAQEKKEKMARFCHDKKLKQHREQELRVLRKREDIAKKLDTAQRFAFEHCLDNRLAIVQGPPGCGKTFLGVKLVETLLQRGLDRPILVMTYKNHALDEFLKQCADLPSCLLSNIVRIGSRSKEPLLDQCNLANVVWEDGRTSKRIFAEVKDVESDIFASGTRAKKNLKDLADSSYIDEKGVLEHLSEEQLESLMLNGNWSRLVVQTGQNTYATRKWVSNKVLPKIKAEFGSVLLFLKAYWAGMVKKVGMALNCYNILFMAVCEWLPSKQKLEELRRLQNNFATLEEEQEIKESGETPEEQVPDELDEDYIRKLQESRQIAGKSEKGGKELRDPLFLRLDKANPTEYGLSDFPSQMNTNQALLQVKDVWCLNDAERIQFVYTLMKNRLDEHESELETALHSLDVLFKQKKPLDLDRKVDAIKGKKIVGVTITGASINHDLLHAIAPKVVIVEEAAEILEPSLLAALHEKVEHLILIGDHKQLKPQVDTYELRKNFHFDQSMMERLIKTGIPFKRLRQQNRMRPEFSALLKDIYPDLEDNLERVKLNRSPECLEKSLFFWTHAHTEDGCKKNKEDGEQDRSKRNTEEAKMVIALALFLLRNGYRPSQITLLASYLGQQKVLRSQLRDYESTHPHLFLREDEDEPGTSMQIQTIDMYQGDENDVVIVSLTRSNDRGDIGFLNELNRRCVAQSRAKCGMYFVGNLETFSKTKKGSSVWLPLLREMSAKELVGPKISVQCPKHMSGSRHQATSAHKLVDFVDRAETLCGLPCGELFPCGEKSHACGRTCNPLHRHDKCHTLVEEVRPGCGHQAERRCYEDLNSIPCQVRVDHVFEKCGHKSVKKCYVKKESLQCQHPCEKKMSCGLHSCPSKCGDVQKRSGRNITPSPHSHSGCEAKVEFTFFSCGHKATKLCHEQESSKKCSQLVSKFLPKCGHEMEAPCSEDASTISCQHPCEKAMHCKVKGHKCKRKCGDVHNHDNCDIMVKYDFPNCRHPSPYKKKCSEPITWSCKETMTEKSPCGHWVEKECWQPVAEVTCPFMPCSKTRTCGHPCLNRCGDPCDKGKCPACEKLELERREKNKENARKRREEILEQLKNATVTFSREVILDDKDTKAEFTRVLDRVMNYIQVMHNWNPRIVKIEKVKNLKLEAKFEAAKMRSVGDFEDLKFHGTSNEGVEGIIRDGFRMPGAPKFGQQPGMYGQGIYFATDSSKSAQEIYTKGSHMLLLCNVLLGRSKEVRSADNKLNKKGLRKEGFDSVYAPRGTEVKNDEFVIFDPAQALPVYIIHYRLEIEFVLSFVSVI